MFNTPIFFHTLPLAKGSFQESIASFFESIIQWSVFDQLDLRIMVLILIASITILLPILMVVMYRNKKQSKGIKSLHLDIQQLMDEKNNNEIAFREIEAVVETQEKYRQQIAHQIQENLHRLLSSLRIDFHNIRKAFPNIDHKKQEVFTTAEEDLNAAFSEIQKVLELRNLGVLGTDGLLAAVTSLAENLSIEGELKIMVIPFGLKERIENTKEIALFRMIQEFCYNSVKHSNASEIVIYLTQHDKKDINVIIEDNGNGFDTRTLVTTKGLSIKKIQSRITELKGSLKIDSIPKKGTSVILEMPI